MQRSYNVMKIDPVSRPYPVHMTNKRFIGRT